MDLCGILRLLLSDFLFLITNFPRSKRETQKLHQLNKPVRVPQTFDDITSLNSNNDEEEEHDWSSNIQDDDLDDSDDRQSTSPTEGHSSYDSDAEMPYEAVPRKLPSEWKTSQGTEVRALPIKLVDGRIKDTGVKLVLNEAEVESDSDGSDKSEERAVEDVSTGARFGRPAVLNILQTKSRGKRVEMAKEQIASICQEILADPENSVSLDMMCSLLSLSYPAGTSSAIAYIRIGYCDYRYST